jgi:hypothetical protein
MMIAPIQPQNLIDILNKSALKEFPREYDYPAQFKSLHNHLNEYYHKDVTASAALSDGSGYLTDHGPDHIRTVVERASMLVYAASGKKPTAYEVYLLLAAIHIHDLGNFFGRASHEINADKVMLELGPMLGDDVEKFSIREIAQAHGGKLYGNKDKIGRLQLEDHIFSQAIRPRFLAALLRLADELADDSTRASRFMIENGIIPESSVIYHKYANSLRSVKVNGDSVSLKFSVAEKDIKQKFGKGSGRVFLVDEIYERTMKTHRERMYCMRFLRPEINIDRIAVSIDIYSEGFTKKLESIEYKLEEAGYPDEKNPDIFQLCPDLRTKTGSAIKASFNKSATSGKKKPAKKASKKK